MMNQQRMRLASRLRFASLGLLACLLFSTCLELFFAAVDMQGLLDEQATRSLLFEQGSVRRSIRENLRSGDIQITLHWHNRNDLDLSCEDPTAEVISFRHTRSSSWGELDFDMNAGGEAFSSNPVENIHWPRNSAPQGHYRVYVNYFQKHGDRDPTDYQGTILADGRTRTFAGQAYYGTGKHLVAEFDIAHGPPSIFGIHPGILYAALVVGGWLGLIGAAVALMLIGAENLWYRKHYRKPILAPAAFARAVCWTFTLSFLIGFVAQLIFGAITLHLPAMAVILLRLACWTACFSLVGLSLSRFVPNMSRSKAFLFSLVTGWLGGTLFLFSSIVGADTLARLIGPMLFGAAVGSLICLVWEQDELPVETITTFSLPPMRMQPYRMTLNRVEQVTAGDRYDPTDKKDSTSPSHEKPD